MLFESGLEDCIALDAERPVTLSKSRFLAGLQCPLRLWYQVWRPDLTPLETKQQQALFDAGRRVGALGNRLYPEGVRLETDSLSFDEAAQATLRTMGDHEVRAIYEGAFSCDDVRVKADILARVGKSAWSLIEVKSSTKIKAEHIPDVAIQYYVLKGSGFDINQVMLMHLNNQYVYDGRNLDGLVKSPSAVLRFIFRHCGVRLCTPHSSRFARLASGAFYCAVGFDDFLRNHQS